MEVMLGEAEMHSEALFSWLKVMSHVTFILKGQKEKGQDSCSWWISPLAAGCVLGPRCSKGWWQEHHSHLMSLKDHCLPHSELLHLLYSIWTLHSTMEDLVTTNGILNQATIVSSTSSTYQTCLFRGIEYQEPPLGLWSISPIFGCKLERAAGWCSSCYSACVTAKACVTPLVLWKHAFVRGEVCWSPLRTMAVTDSLEYLVPIKAWSQVSDALSKYIWGSYIKSCLYSKENELRARPSPICHM